jgi:hypothetical protein
MPLAEKPLLVLQALNRAKHIDERDPEYHIQLAKFSAGCKGLHLTMPFGLS